MHFIVFKIATNSWDVYVRMLCDIYELTDSVGEYHTASSHTCTKVHIDTDKRRRVMKIDLVVHRAPLKTVTLVHLVKFALFTCQS